MSRAPRFLVRTVAPLDDPALLRETRGPVQDEMHTAISHIRVRAECKKFVSVSWNSAVIWDLDRLLPLRTVTRPSYLFAAQQPHAGDELLTVGSDGYLVTWDAHTGQVLRETSLNLPAPG